MANPFEVRVPNVLEGLMSGQEGYRDVRGAIKERQISEVRESAAQEIMQGGNPQNALARLLSIGDDKGASTLAGVIAQRSQQDYQNRSLAETSRYHDMTAKNQQAQLAETARYHSGSLAHQAAQLRHAQETAKGAEIKTVKDAAGNETLVRVDRQGNAVQINTGAAPAAGNPYAAGGKFTEVQGKAATFADRMAASHKTITDLEGINDSLSGAIGGAMANSPIMGADSLAYNALASKDRQKILQAQRDFVNAILRRESGAAISTGEFVNATRQYFPQPGDSPEVLQQKRKNRILAIEGNMRESGPSYRPPEGWTGPGKNPTAAPAIPPPPPGFTTVK